MLCPRRNSAQSSMPSFSQRSHANAARDRERKAINSVRIQSKLR
jgi:hypothetical protein